MLSFAILGRVADFLKLHKPLYKKPRMCFEPGSLAVMACARFILALLPLCLAYRINLTLFLLLIIKS